MYQNFPPNTVTERPREVDPPVRPSEALRARLRLHFLAESVVVVSRPPPADALALDSASSAMPPPAPPGLTLRGANVLVLTDHELVPPTARYASVDVHTEGAFVSSLEPGARRRPSSAPRLFPRPRLRLRPIRPPRPTLLAPRAARHRLRRDDAHDRPGGLARARHGEQRESAHAQRDARELTMPAERSRSSTPCSTAGSRPSATAAARTTAWRRPWTSAP